MPTIRLDDGTEKDVAELTATELAALNPYVRTLQEDTIRLRRKMKAEKTGSENASGEVTSQPTAPQVEDTASSAKTDQKSTPPAPVVDADEIFARVLQKLEERERVARERQELREKIAAEFKLNDAARRVLEQVEPNETKLRTVADAIARAGLVFDTTPEGAATQPSREQIVAGLLKRMNLTTEK